MKRLGNALILFILGLAMMGSTAFAGDGDAACAACGGSILFVAIAWAVIVIAILVWVTKDSKARGMSSIGWLILTLVFGPLGLIIYIFARTKGEKIECPNCGNSKLASLSPCPHCGK